jgi:hypothetical protein
MIQDRFPTLADCARNIAARRRVRRQLFNISQFANNRRDETILGLGEKRGLQSILRGQRRQPARYIVPLAIISTKNALE